MKKDKPKIYRTPTNIKSIKSIKQFEYTGKKRVVSQNYIGKKRVNENILKNRILYCFHCGWKFPDKMKDKRKNAHVYKCFEGSGKLDIMQYEEEQKLKLYRKYPNKKLTGLNMCPICGKDMEKDNPKEKRIHLYDCSKIFII